MIVSRCAVQMCRFLAVGGWRRRRAADVRLLLFPRANFNRLLRLAWLFIQGNYFLGMNVCYAQFLWPFFECWHVN